MTRRLLVSLALAAAVLLAPASAAVSGAATRALHASAASTATASTLPTISRVSPLKLPIGGKLTIRGAHFVPGKLRNTVVFMRSGAPAVFLRAQRATSTRLTVTVTAKLTRFLLVRNTGEKAPTRFRLRVLARRFGASFTPQRLSPTILPASADGGGTPTSCTLDSAKLAPTADSDGDLLANALELKIKTDPCNADSDGDKVTDGYEYESALDLNSRALPYPGKRPYPNALDPSDPGVDYDGDGLTLLDEYSAWVAYGSKTLPLNYSDGTQSSGGPVAVTSETAWEDLDGNGFLTDDEKDVDHDGLVNWDEAHGRMQPDWWTKVVSTEKPFTVKFLATDWLDPDTDGDGLADGADDVDHDGYANANELNRGPLWVQPFNPCLPDPFSITCPKHPPLADESYPPFAPGGMQPNEPTPLVWPRP